METFYIKIEHMLRHFIHQHTAVNQETDCSCLMRLYLLDGEIFFNEDLLLQKQKH